jgi:hypothetical protein
MKRLQLSTFFTYAIKLENSFHKFSKFEQFLMAEKIGCASRVRVNLPNIGNRECFKFVL